MPHKEAHTHEAFPQAEQEYRKLNFQVTVIKIRAEVIYTTSWKLEQELYQERTRLEWAASY